MENGFFMSYTVIVITREQEKNDCKLRFYEVDNGGHRPRQIAQTKCLKEALITGKIEYRRRAEKLIYYYIIHKKIFAKEI